MQWFRWYRGTVSNAKFRVVSHISGASMPEVVAMWAMILEDAAHDQHRGVCELGEHDFTAILNMSNGTVTAILSAMNDKDLISIKGSTIAVVNWGERQYETDLKDPTNADRQRRHRQKLRDNKDVTERNGSVTETKRPETDTDTEVILLKEDTPISDAVEIYRAVATDHDLPQPRLTDRVKANLSKTLKAYGLEEWQAGCGKIRGSPFLRGENDRGWQVTLSWLAEKSKFEKVIEGRYDGTAKPKPTQSDRDNEAFRKAAQIIEARR